MVCEDRRLDIEMNDFYGKFVVSLFKKTISGEIKRLKMVFISFKVLWHWIGSIGHRLSSCCAGVWWTEQGSILSDLCMMLYTSKSTSILKATIFDAIFSLMICTACNAHLDFEFNNYAYGHMPDMCGNGWTFLFNAVFR